ncbi:DUF4279 domain-containing protein [Caulobacter sp. 602-2]|uniref:DUF4279 domain-containing protein n=1 Tax=Caulobacter sp. 602-2 TaxID=2710887 RepID=A0A6G4QYQ9_9CAUL|nr:DUF4279 domain-containing protein [Caulobacter sp. 602-2]
MGALQRTEATLRFFGDDLDPAEVSERLGAKPTVGVRKGDSWRTSRGVEKVAPTGSWRLEARAERSGDLDGQISELLGALSQDLDAWRALVARYKADVFCGLFLASGNDGVDLRPETLAALGERGLRLDFDIYGVEA